MRTLHLLQLLLPLLLLTLLTFPSGTSATTPKPKHPIVDPRTKEQICKDKNKKMWDLIGSYCHNGGALIVSPGSHANLGKHGAGPTGSSPFIAIRSGGVFGMKRGPKCSPFQLVPEYWCREQFFDMCAAYKPGQDAISRNYGNGGCQNFWMQFKYG